NRRPRVPRPNLNKPDRLDPRLRRLYSEEARGLTALDTAPELAFGGDNQVLVERIGMGGDLNPFAAAGDHREDSTSRGDHPHIVLQLRHIFLGRRLFRERPGQHELGLEHRTRCFDSAIEGSRHPTQYWMPDLPLDVREHLTGIGLKPAPIEALRSDPKLHDEITGQVLRFDL